MIFKIRNGIVKSIYDDDSFEFAKTLGSAVIKRATHVEYDNAKRRWVATTADLEEDNIEKPGTIIAETETRKEAITRELDFLKQHL